jgi:hypothetical protein
MKQQTYRITYNTRAINFEATVTFQHMGKYVTDFLAGYRRKGYVVEHIVDSAQQDPPGGHEKLITGDVASPVPQREEMDHEWRWDELANFYRCMNCLVLGNADHGPTCPARPSAAEQPTADAARAASPPSREDRLVDALFASIDYLKALGHPFATWPDSLKRAFSDAMIDPRPPTEADIHRTRELIELGILVDSPPVSAVLVLVPIDVFAIPPSQWDRIGAEVDRLRAAGLISPQTLLETPPLNAVGSDPEGAGMEDGLLTAQAETESAPPGGLVDHLQGDTK